MKKTNMFCLVLLFVLFLSPHTQSQTPDEASAIDYTGTSLLGAGFYFGYYNYSYLGSRSLSVPPMSAYYELGVHEYITVGPFFGYAQWSYRYTFLNSTSNYTWSFMHIGARGSFHLVSLLNEAFGDSFDEEKIDIYLTAMSGLEFRNYSFQSGINPENYDNRWRIFFGPIAGIRYYFSDNFAVYFEGGRGALGAASIGITTRF